jgi:hypothetical protein
MTAKEILEELEPLGRESYKRLLNALLDEPRSSGREPAYYYWQSDQSRVRPDLCLAARRLGLNFQSAVSPV